MCWVERKSIRRSISEEVSLFSSPTIPKTHRGSSRYLLATSKRAIAFKMKISLLSLLLTLSSCSAVPVSSQSNATPSSSTSQSGFSDPLTLARRVGALRQKSDGGNSSSVQTEIHDSSVTNGCGSNCDSTLHFAGKGELLSYIGMSRSRADFMPRRSQLPRLFSSL